MGAFVGVNGATMVGDIGGENGGVLGADVELYEEREAERGL